MGVRGERERGGSEVGSEGREREEGVRREREREEEVRLGVRGERERGGSEEGVRRE